MNVVVAVVVLIAAVVAVVVALVVVVAVVDGGSARSSGGGGGGGIRYTHLPDRTPGPATNAIVRHNIRNTSSCVLYTLTAVELVLACLPLLDSNSMRQSKSHAVATFGRSLRMYRHSLGGGKCWPPVVTHTSAGRSPCPRGPSAS
jgi:hypothetical protein